MTGSNQSLAEIVELLANNEHATWASWQKWLQEEVCVRHPDGLIIPQEKVARWERQYNTPYKDLPEEEKESDRLQVRETAAQILALVESRDEVINKNYYLRLDDSKRLTLDLTEHKSLEECVRLTMSCINEMASQEPAYNAKLSRTYFQPNSNPAKAHKNGYRLGVRETKAKLKANLGLTEKNNEQ